MNSHQSFMIDPTAHCLHYSLICPALWTSNATSANSTGITELQLYENNFENTTVVLQYAARLALLYAVVSRLWIVMMLTLSSWTSPLRVLLDFSPKNMIFTKLHGQDNKDVTTHCNTNEIRDVDGIFVDAKSCGLASHAHKSNELRCPGNQSGVSPTFCVWCWDRLQPLNRISGRKWMEGNWYILCVWMCLCILWNFLGLYVEKYL